MSLQVYRHNVRIGPVLAGMAPNLFGDAGDYWAAPATRTTLALVDGIMYTHGVYCARDCTIDRIGASVTAGSAGSTLTLGIYEDDGDGEPGAVVLDAGTIDGNSATAQEITIDQALAGGRLYHFATLCEGGTPTVRALSPAGAGWSGRSASLAVATGSTTVYQGRLRASLTGTDLPDPAATTALQTTIPNVVVRFA